MGMGYSFASYLSLINIAVLCIVLRIYIVLLGVSDYNDLYGAKTRTKFDDLGVNKPLNHHCCCLFINQFL
jgi:hypothetical protein